MAATQVMLNVKVLPLQDLTNSVTGSPTRRPLSTTQPAAHFAKGFSLDQTFRTVLKKLEQRFNEQYNKNKLLPVTFSTIKNNSGADIDPEDTLREVGYQSSHSDEQRVVYVIQDELATECYSPAEPPPQPKNSRKRIFGDASAQCEEIVKRPRSDEHEEDNPSRPGKINDNEIELEGDKGLYNNKHKGVESVSRKLDFKVPAIPLRKTAPNEIHSSQQSDSSQATVLVQDSQPGANIVPTPEPSSPTAVAVERSKSFAPIFWNTAAQPSEKRTTGRYSSPQVNGSQKNLPTPDTVGAAYNHRSIPNPHMLDDMAVSSDAPTSAQPPRASATLFLNKMKRAQQPSSTGYSPPNMEEDPIIDDSQDRERDPPPTHVQETVSKAAAKPRKARAQLRDASVAWSPEEDETLIAGLRRHCTSAQLKKQYGLSRSESAIRNRRKILHKKGLIPQNLGSSSSQPTSTNAPSASAAVGDARTNNLINAFSRQPATQSSQQQAFSSQQSGLSTQQQVVSGQQPDDSVQQPLASSQELQQSSQQQKENSEPPATSLHTSAHGSEQPAIINQTSKESDTNHLQPALGLVASIEAQHGTFSVSNTHFARDGATESKLNSQNHSAQGKHSGGSVQQEKTTGIATTAEIQGHKLLDKRREDSPIVLIPTKAQHTVAPEESALRSGVVSGQPQKRKFPFGHTYSSTDESDRDAIQAQLDSQLTTMADAGSQEATSAESVETAPESATSLNSSKLPKREGAVTRMRQAIAKNTHRSTVDVHGDKVNHDKLPKSQATATVGPSEVTATTSTLRTSPTPRSFTAQALTSSINQNESHDVPDAGNTEVTAMAFLNTPFETRPRNSRGEIEVGRPPNTRWVSASQPVLRTDESLWSETKQVALPDWRSEVFEYLKNEALSLVSIMYGDQQETARLDGVRQHLMADRRKKLHLTDEDLDYLAQELEYEDDDDNQLCIIPMLKEYKGILDPLRMNYHGRVTEVDDNGEELDVQGVGRALKIKRKSLTQHSHERENETVVAHELVNAAPTSTVLPSGLATYDELEKHEDNDLDLPDAPPTGIIANDNAPTNEELQDLVQSGGSVQYSVYDDNINMVGVKEYPIGSIPGAVPIIDNDDENEWDDYDRERRILWVRPIEEIRSAVQNEDGAKHRDTAGDADDVEKFRRALAELKAAEESASPEDADVPEQPVLPKDSALADDIADDDILESLHRAITSTGHVEEQISNVDGTHDSEPMEDNRVPAHAEDDSQAVAATYDVDMTHEIEAASRQLASEAEAHAAQQIRISKKKKNRSRRRSRAHPDEEDVPSAGSQTANVHRAKRKGTKASSKATNPSTTTPMTQVATAETNVKNSNKQKRRKRKRQSRTAQAKVIDTPPVTNIMPVRSEPEIADIRDPPEIIVTQGVEPSSNTPNTAVRRVQTAAVHRTSAQTALPATSLPVALSTYPAISRGAASSALSHSRPTTSAGPTQSGSGIRSASLVSRPSPTQAPPALSKFDTRRERHIARARMQPNFRGWESPPRLTARQLQENRDKMSREFLTQICRAKGHELSDSDSPSSHSDDE